MEFTPNMLHVYGGSASEFAGSDRQSGCRAFFLFFEKVRIFIFYLNYTKRMYKLHKWGGDNIKK